MTPDETPPLAHSPGARLPRRSRPPAWAQQASIEHAAEVRASLEALAGVLAGRTPALDYDHAVTDQSTLPEVAASEGEEARDFRLLPGEDLPGGLRRVASSQLRGAAERLRSAPAGERAEAVHEARKSLKRERALLRLVRGPLKPKAFKSVDAQLRDVARALAQARDAEVMLATLDELLADQLPLDAQQAATQEALRTLHARLEADAERERDALEDGSVGDVAALLAEHAVRVEEWTGPTRRFGEIAPGLRTVYERGRAEGRQARRDPDDEALHDWRKSVKYLRHCAEVLTPLRPGLLGRMAARARRLGDVLGDHHDLAVLRELALADRGPGAPEATALQPLLEAIDARREALAAEAFALGGELYSRRPERFVLAVRTGWRKRSRGGVLQAD